MRQGLDRECLLVKSMINEIQQLITQYGDISVSFKHEKIQQDKQQAFQNRLADLVNRFHSLSNEIVIKKRQFLELAQKRKETLLSSRASFSRPRGSGESDDGPGSFTGNQQQMQSDEVEELKIQGEIDFNDNLIKERQEGLDDAEALIMETRDLAKQINSKVHEQREDILAIEQNADEALHNAEEAEENIEKAEEHQEEGAKCMYWIVAVIGIIVIVIVVIVLLSIL